MITRTIAQMMIGPFYIDLRSMVCLISMTEGCDCSDWFAHAHPLHESLMTLSRPQPLVE
jgi:hypothetical protein